MPAPRRSDARSTPEFATIAVEPVWRISVSKYHEMIAAGILTSEDKVELLEGLLVPRMSKNPPHSARTAMLRKGLERSLPAGWIVRVQDPITLEASEPEPDLAVVRGAERDFMDRHPGPRDIALVVEVTDSSLHRDKVTKLRIYASAGIPVYWVLNLNSGHLEVYSEPRDSTYTRSEAYRSPGAVPIPVAGAQPLDLTGILS